MGLDTQQLKQLRVASDYLLLYCKRLWRIFQRLTGKLLPLIKIQQKRHSVPLVLEGKGKIVSFDFSLQFTCLCCSQSGDNKKTCSSVWYNNVLTLDEGSQGPLDIAQKN